MNKLIVKISHNASFTKSFEFIFRKKRERRRKENFYKKKKNSYLEKGPVKIKQQQFSN
jgi:hypothetical protein